MTTITVTGRISEPSLRYTPSGKPVCEFAVFDNHRRKDGSEWVDDGSTAYRVSAWDHLGEKCAELTKGQRVIVVGELRNREYEKDGEKRRSLEIRAYEVGPALDKYRPRDGGTSRPAAQGDPWTTAPADDSEAPF